MFFLAQDSTTPDMVAGEILSRWSTVTHGSNVSNLIFSAVTGGSGGFSNPMTLKGNGILDVTTGFSVAGAAASATILQSDGIKYNPSTPTWPTVASTSGKVVQSNGTNLVMSTPTFAAPGISGNLMTSDGTNWTSAAPVLSASSTTTLTNKRIDPRTTTSATGNTTPTPDVSTTDEYIATAMTVNMVFGAPTGTPVQGTKLLIRIKDDGTARTLGWNATYAPIGVTLPTTTVANKVIYVMTVYNSTVPRWDVLAVGSEL